MIKFLTIPLILSASVARAGLNIEITFKLCTPPYQLDSPTSNEDSNSQVSTSQPWVEKLLRHLPSRMQPFDVTHVSYEEVAKCSSGSCGIVTLSSSSFQTVFFYVRFDVGDLLVESKLLENGFSGGLSKNEATQQYIAARQQARNMVADQATKIDGIQAKVIFWNGLPDGSRNVDFLLSAQGHYFAHVSDSLLRVFRTADLKVIGEWTAPPISESTYYLAGLSDDGRYVSIKRNWSSNEKSYSQSALIDMKLQREVETLDADLGGYPKISFFKDGYSKLYPKKLEVISKNGAISSYSLIDYRESNENNPFWKSDFVWKAPRAAFFDSDRKDIVLFFHGRPPIRFERRNMVFFSDSRAKGSQRLLDHSTDLLETLSSDQFLGFEGQFAISRDGRMAAQIKESGSGRELNLSAKVQIFQTEDGTLVGSVNPFYSIGAVALNADGKLLAISEHQDGPVPSQGPKRIWIYSTKSLDKPLVVINQIDVHMIAAMVFSANDEALFIQATNNGKILKFDLPQLKP